MNVPHITLLYIGLSFTVHRATMRVAAETEEKETTARPLVQPGSCLEKGSLGRTS